MGGKQKGIKGWQAGHTKARETQAKAAIKGWQAGHTKAQETQAKAAIRDFCARQGDGQGHQKLASRALKQALWPLQAFPRQRTVPSHIHVSGLCQATSMSADCAKPYPRQRTVPRQPPPPPQTPKRLKAAPAFLWACARAHLCVSAGPSLPLTRPMGSTARGSFSASCCPPPARLHGTAGPL